MGCHHEWIAAEGLRHPQYRVAEFLDRPRERDTLRAGHRVEIAENAKFPQVHVRSATARLRQKGRLSAGIVILAPGRSQSALGGPNTLYGWLVEQGLGVLEVGSRIGVTA